VSPCGTCVAAGSELVPNEDALLLFWDPRNAREPLRTHASTHADDVTALHFLPPALRLSHRQSGSRYDGVDKVVLSAGSDGLLCTSNAEEADEDEAGVSVGNWGCSVAQCGWVPVQSTFGMGARVWAASDMETFSVWTDEVRSRAVAGRSSCSTFLSTCSWILYVTSTSVSHPFTRPRERGSRTTSLVVILHLPIPSRRPTHSRSSSDRTSESDLPRHPRPIHLSLSVLVLIWKPILGRELNRPLLPQRRHRRPLAIRSFK
jgi:hypothetical protein